MYAPDYWDGTRSKKGCVVAETKFGCFLVTFYDERAPQHTRGREMKLMKDKGISVKKEAVDKPESEETYYFAVGEKVWARERGVEWERGRVIEVFVEHQTALVTFFHETGFPSQNTKFSEMSKSKQKPV